MIYVNRCSINQPEAEFKCIRPTVLSSQQYLGWWDSLRRSLLVFVLIVTGDLTDRLISHNTVLLSIYCSDSIHGVRNCCSGIYKFCARPQKLFKCNDVVVAKSWFTMYGKLFSASGNVWSKSLAVVYVGISGRHI